MIFGAIPPPRNFAKIRTRGGRGLLPIQPKDSIPPWGHTGTRRARRGWFAPESSGRRRTGGGVPRRARRGRFSPGRRFRGAGSRSLPSGRREAGRGRAWPREAHKGRVAGAAARGGHVAGRRGAGGLRGFPGRKRGRRGGRRARGGKAGAAARCRGAAGGGAEKWLHPARLV